MTLSTLSVCFVLSRWVTLSTLSVCFVLSRWVTLSTLSAAFMCVFLRFSVSSRSRFHRVNCFFLCVTTKLQSLATLCNEVTYSSNVIYPCFITSSVSVIANTFIPGAQNELNLSMTVSYFSLGGALLTRSGISALLVAMRNCSNVRLYRFHYSGRFLPSVNDSGVSNLSIVPYLFCRLSYFVNAFRFNVFFPNDFFVTYSFSSSPPKHHVHVLLC